MQVFNTAPTIETERLTLRAHQLSDFPDIVGMWADPKVVRHISGKPSTPEESWSRMLRYCGHWQLMGYGFWAIQNKANSEYIGETGIANFRRALTPSQGDRPEAGWVLKSAEHGKGYATEAATAIIDWADEHLDYPGTFCILDPAHTASLNVASKIGFTNETLGTYRDQPTLILTREKPERVKR